MLGLFTTFHTRKLLKRKCMQLLELNLARLLALHHIKSFESLNDESRIRCVVMISLVLIKDLSIAVK